MHDKPLTALQHHLAVARSRLRVAAVRNAVIRSIVPGLWMVCAILGGFVAWDLFNGMSGVSDVAFMITVGSGAFLALLLSMLIHVLPAWCRYPDLDTAAQRLDLATDNHNRIATALEFARRSDASPLELAAIRDGVLTVERLCTRIPSYQYVPPRWRRMQAPLLVICMLIATMWITSGSPTVTKNDPAHTETSIPSELEARHAESQEIEPDAPSTFPSEQPSLASANNPGRQTTAQDSGDPAVTRTSPGSTNPGESLTAAKESNAGNSSGAAARAPISERLVSSQPTRSPRTNRHIPDPTYTKPARAESHSSNGAGNSGDSRLARAMNDTRSTHAALASDEEASPDDELDDEDELRGSQQRGGLQPIAKDRNAAPSRDLGLGSSLEGRPGTGRGGPTPTKKSRGTASLVLGVPLPDYVPGRMRSGKHKVDRGRSAPVANPGAPHAATAVASRNTDEALVKRYEIPMDVRHTVRTFLIAWHASDGTKVASPVKSDSAVDIENSNE